MDDSASSLTFIEYYKQKYNEAITDPHQPLLVCLNKRTGQAVCLVPELCRMTGLSEQQRDDFKLMREVKRLTCTDAPAKVSECQLLFKAFAEAPRARRLLGALAFAQTPVRVLGRKHEAGHLVLGPGL